MSVSNTFNILKQPELNQITHVVNYIKNAVVFKKVQLFQNIFHRNVNIM